MVSNTEVNRPRTVCFTGHRPKGLPWESNKDDVRCQVFLAKLENAIDIALAKGFRHFICGNATGVDTWAAELVLAKKTIYPDIYLEIALPFKGHNETLAECQNVMHYADLVHIVSQSKYRRQAFLDRNKYMVDHSSLLIAGADREGWSGGAGRTYTYAVTQGLEIITVLYEKD